MYPDKCTSPVFVEPFLVFSRLLIGQCLPKLRVYISISWFGVHWTSPDSLHMQLHVDEIILKYRWWLR